MACNATPDEALIALTNDELGPWRRWRLRRHLARCADCRAAHADVQALWKAARITRDAARGEDDVKERLYASLRTAMWQEPDATPQSRLPLMPRRTKRATLAAALLTTLILVTPVAGVVLYVHYSRQEEERRKIGADWQQLGWMTQQDYVKLRQMTDGVRNSGALADPDLDWSLNLMRKGRNDVAHARVLGMYTLLRQITPAQREKLQAAIAPLLTSTNRLDRASAARVQAVLDRP